MLWLNACQELMGKEIRRQGCFLVLNISTHDFPVRHRTTGTTLMQMQWSHCQTIYRAVAAVWRYPRALERSDLQCKVERGRSNGRGEVCGKSKEGDSKRWSEGSPCDRLPSVSLGLCEKMAPRSACVCVCAWCGGGRAALLCVVVVSIWWSVSPSSSTTTSSSSCLAVVGFSSSPRAKKDSCFTGVSISRPFPLHLDTSSQLRSCVHSSAVQLCLLVYFLYFNCRLSLDTSVIWSTGELTTANCFYLGNFFFVLFF